MQFERVDDREALLNERGCLEDALQGCEEWCALLQLKARVVRGGYRPSVHTKRLETSLLATLETNADFQRYRAVVIAMTQLPELLPELLPDLPDVRSAGDAVTSLDEPVVIAAEPLPVEPLVFLPTPLVAPARRVPPPVPQSHTVPAAATPSPRAMFAKLAEPGNPGAVRVRSENPRTESVRPSSQSKTRPAEGRASTPAGRFLKALTGY